MRFRLRCERLFPGGFDFRRALRRNFFDRCPGYLWSLDGGLRLRHRRFTNFGLGPLFFGLRNFYSTRAATNNIRANPALHNGFARLDVSQALVLGLHHAIGDNFFFPDMDLGLLLRGQGRANACDLIVLEGALGLAPSHTQLVKLGDEVLCLHPQFFSQQMDSCFSHLLLPVSLLQILNESFFRVLVDRHVKRPAERFSPQESLPAFLIVVQIAASTPALFFDLQARLVSGNQTD